MGLFDRLLDEQYNNIGAIDEQFIPISLMFATNDREREKEQSKIKFYFSREKTQWKVLN